MRIRDWTGRNLPFILPLSLLAAVVLTQFGIVSPWPGRDSGVYLYTAQQWLAGKLLYRQLWDHKMPLIYWLDALGLGLGGGSWWGVRVLESAWLALTAGLLWRGLAPRFGGLATALALAAWAVGLQNLMEGGNLPESFVALPQAVLLVAVLVSDAPSMAALAGLAAGSILLLKINLVGLPLFGLVHFLRRRRLLPYFAGALIPAVAAVAYLGAEGCLAAALDQTFRYNWYYAVANMASRRHALEAGVKWLGLSGLLPLALAGALRLRRRESFFAAGLGLAVGLDLALICLPGRGYRHNYLPLLVPLTVLAAVGAAGLGCRTWARAVGLALALAVLVPALRAASRPSWNPSRELAGIAAIVPPGQPLLIWGAFSVLNFLSGHPSPCANHYQYGLFTCGYANAGAVTAFEDQLDGSGTRWVLDMSSAEGIVPPLDPGADGRWRSPEGTYGEDAPGRELRRHILERFVPAGNLPGTAWPLYRRKGGSHG